MMIEGVIIIGTGTGRRLGTGVGIITGILTGSLGDKVTSGTGRTTGMGKVGKVSSSPCPWTLQPLSPNTGFSGEAERSDIDPRATAPFDGDSSSNGVNDSPKPE